MNNPDKQKIEDDLNLLVNGRLEETEQESLKKAVKDDEDLANELNFLNQLKTGLQTEAVPLPGEMGLAKFKKQLNQDSEVQPRTSRIPTSLWQGLAAAACLILVIQNAYVLVSKPEDGIAMQPLSGGTNTATGVAHLQVAFVSSATIADIEKALTGIQANIVSGPSALGLYELSLADPKTLNQVITKLQNNAAIEEVNAL